MTRVVPSQVRNFAEAEFGRGTAQSWNIPREHSSKLAGLLVICEQLPDELLTLTGADYANYIAALATIQHQLAAWNHKVDPPTLPHVSGKNPVWVIYNALKACPDEFPSPQTTSLAFITDEQLRDSIRLDISAANHHLAHAQYKSTTVLAGSATEALLLWAIEESRKRSSRGLQAAVQQAVQAGDLKKNRPPEEWLFSELIEVALRLQCIKDSTAQQARLGKNFRNLIHPGRATRLQITCNRGTAFSALATVELVASDLSIWKPGSKSRP